MSIFDIMSQQQSPSMGGTGGIGALGAGNAIYPQSRMDKTQYATPMQLPTSAEVISSDYDPKTDAYTGMPSRFAKGGEVEGDSSDIDYRIMALSANPKYDPRYMPLRVDDRPMSDIQAAILRLQAEKQIGEGTARAGVAGLLGAIPGRHGVSALPGAYDIGYRTPVGSGDLDVSAFRAMKAMPDGKVPQGVRASYTVPFAEGGDVDVSGESGWNPETGTVKLQQLEDPKDPFSPVKSVVDYTIPKDQFKTFVPDTDLETGAATGSGKYILKDGSTMSVDNKGIVQAATPGRSEYTLNKEGYYQPTGSGLEWRGDLNMLTKKIGGVDVQVPGIYHKGGYQDAQGKLRTDENGVPVALAPNYLDSGFGQSGLADAAPYIMAAALTAGAGLTAMPAVGAAEAGGALTTAELMGGAGGAFVPAAGSGASFALPAGAYTAAGAGAAGSGSWGLSPQLAAELGLEGSTSGLSTSGTLGSQTLESMGLNTAAAKGMTAGQKLIALNLATKALGGASGSGGNGGGYTTTQSAPTQSVSSSQFQPSNYMPAMFSMNQASTPGSYYQPYIYRYAQGGLADLGGYAAGGKLLKGAGDGMSDDIVANIEGDQPARLADGEFVIPADVVSHLGNGSTDAGAKQLYRMMDKIRHARTGNKKQGKRINPEKFFPKG